MQKDCCLPSRGLSPSFKEAIGLFNFLKKMQKNKVIKQGGDSTISSNEIMEGSEISAEELVKTQLSFHPEAKVGAEEKYYFQFLNNELADLKENQISISGIDLKKDKNQVLVTAFVRSSLPKGIKLQEMNLLLIGPQGEKIGKKKFDLSLLGELPPLSSRPWEFTFNEKDLFVKEIPQMDWKLAFELTKEKKPHALDLEESWQKSLADGDKENLQKLVAGMQPPKPGEVNFLGIQIKQDDDRKLHTTLLIRNGSDKDITLQQLPLIVEDASGDVIAKGGFKLENLVVKSNTSKPWTFIFPSDLVLKENPDLSKWKAYPAKTNQK
jgi:accessory Sec system S-layer assembly protein